MANLTDVLTSLVDSAGQTETACDIGLTGGLHVHLRKGGGGYMLTIWRFQKPPSVREWNTICAYWPYSLGAPNFSNSGVTKKGQYFKQARIPLEAR